MNSALRALLLTLIGIGAVLGVLFLFSGAERIEIDGRNFLDSYFGGDDDMMQAYGAMTAGFAARNDMRAFHDQRAYYFEVLGAFREVTDVVDEAIEPGGRGRLEMRVAFEKGEVPVVFDMRREKERWRVDDFNIQVPRSLAPDRPWVKPQNFGRTLSSRWAQGGDGVEGVYDLFASSLRKAVDASLFAERSAAMLESVGAYDKVEDGSLDDSNPDEPAMEFTIKFAKSSHAAKVALVWEKGRWFVTRFEVEGLSLE